MAERDTGHSAQLWNVHVRVLIFDGVLDNIRFIFFDQFAAPQGIGIIEALVEIDHPIAVFAYTFANRFAGARHRADALVRIVDVVHDAAVSGADAIGSVTRFHHCLRGVANALHGLG